MKNENFEKLCDKYNIDWGMDYAEPGYSLEGKRFILLANWNNVPNKLYKALEVNYQLEWSDEWVGCSNCGKMLRTSPNSHQWQASYYLGDGEILCLDCLDWDYVIDDYIDNYKKALTCSLYDAIGQDGGLLIRGFAMFDNGNKYFPGEYENGFHPGQNASPESIMNEIKGLYPGCHVLFAMTDQSQFDVTFKAFYKLDDNEDN